MMVGLSLVLEGSNSGTNRKNYYTNITHQIVSKASMIITKTSPTSQTPKSPNPFSRNFYPFSNSVHSNFLDNCFLCRKKLLPSHDIYMYKGDRAFCSEECRCREMNMDEEKACAIKANKTKRGELCSLAAIKPQRQLASPSSPSSPSSSRSSRKGHTKRSNGFVY